MNRSLPKKWTGRKQTPVTFARLDDYVNDPTRNSISNNNMIRIIDFSDAKKLVLMKSFYNEDEFIDMRTWVRFSNSDRFYPTRKGIYMLKRDFMEKFLPQLHELIGFESRTTA